MTLNHIFLKNGYRIVLNYGQCEHLSSYQSSFFMNGCVRFNFDQARTPIPGSGG